MRILFCNIAWMNYYQGIFPGKDEPENGGSYVEEYDDAHEAFNFQSVHLNQKDTEYEEGDYCLGFVETKTTNGRERNQLHIEKIEGCNLLRNESEVEDVLVIYCAKYPDSFSDETYVVGWYKHATVYRYYEIMSFKFENGQVYEQAYNTIARKENCTLLPRSKRRNTKLWKVPRKKSGAAYGFGQANVWFAQGEEDCPELKRFLKRIIDNIEAYDGENWVDCLKDNIDF